MTIADAIDLYAYTLTTRLKRRFLRYAVVTPANDNGWGRAT